MLVKAKVNLSNLLYQVMPQINDLMKDSSSNHKLTDFVKRYIHYQNILDMGEKKFTADYCKWVKNKHSLIAYFGIDSPPYELGKFSATERHISKRGNKYLRKTSYEIMQNLIMHKPTESLVFGFIQKKRDEGKYAKKAMIAGLNKFLRIYYGKVIEVYKGIFLDFELEA